jgi:adenylate kinase family enzyme
VPAEVFEQILEQEFTKATDEAMLLVNYPKMEEQWQALHKVLERYPCELKKVWYLKLENPKVFFHTNRQQSGYSLDAWEGLKIKTQKHQERIEALVSIAEIQKVLTQITLKEWEDLQVENVKKKMKSWA